MKPHIPFRANYPTEHKDKGPKDPHSQGRDLRTPTARARDLRTLIDLKLALPCHPRGGCMY